MMQVYKFMKKYQDQLPGFKYVINEIFLKQIFTAANLKLTGMLTLDFEAYLTSCSQAHDLFFEDVVV